MKHMQGNRTDSITGCLLGSAVGDAMGLPYEGLTARRRERMFPLIEEHGLVLGRRMCSDDTEHTCMVAQALVVSGGDPDVFVKSLAWRLRFWLLGLPAGVGFATLRGILKLCLGFSWRNSGVFSAGNGPAMRSAVLGVCFGENAPLLEALVQRSSRLTHSDPKAAYAAHAIALAAYAAQQGSSDPGFYLELLQQRLPSESEELLDLIERACRSVVDKQSTRDFARDLGLANGISGYAYHTVPVAIHAWLSHPTEYRSAILSVIARGGDTDTTAAIVGGIVGAGVGRVGIPEDWLASLIEWPRTVTWLESLGKRLGEVVHTRTPQTPVSLNVAAILLRNLFFLAVVLSHGFRRLLPPY